jgi:hypothetical protein
MPSLNLFPGILRSRKRFASFAFAILAVLLASGIVVVRHFSPGEEADLLPIDRTVYDGVRVGMAEVEVRQAVPFPCSADLCRPNRKVIFHTVVGEDGAIWRHGQVSSEGYVDVHPQADGSWLLTDRDGTPIGKTMWWKSSEFLLAVHLDLGGRVIGKELFEYRAE